MTANLNIVVGVAASILALQILGIIFSFCLCKAIGNDRDYHYKYWHRFEGAKGAPVAPAPPPRKHRKNPKSQEETQALVLSEQKR